MEKLLFITMALFCFSATAQENFKWEKADSVAKSKSQIYSDTKLFIAETWKSAKDVIQNDDKDGGIILIKGACIRNVTHFMAQYEYVYSYSVTFRMKDNKFKINIDNVYCESARMPYGKNRVVKIEPFDGDNCPQTGTFSSPGIPKKEAIIMMAEVRSDLQNILDSYLKKIKQPSTTDEW